MFWSRAFRDLREGVDERESPDSIDRKSVGEGVDFSGVNFGNKVLDRFGMKEEGDFGNEKILLCASLTTVMAEGAVQVRVVMVGDFEFCFSECQL